MEKRIVSVNDRMRAGYRYGSLSPRSEISIPNFGTRAVVLASGEGA